MTSNKKEALRIAKRRVANALATERFCEAAWIRDTKSATLQARCKEATREVRESYAMYFDLTVPMLSEPEELEEKDNAQQTGT